MSQEILARATELAQEGAPDAAIALLKPLLPNESFRRQAIPVMASCYEGKKDYATAAHLYLEATKLDPKHPDWPKRLQACGAETEKAIGKAEATHRWGTVAMALSAVPLILGVVLAGMAKAAPDFLHDRLRAVFPLRSDVDVGFVIGVAVAVAMLVLFLAGLRSALTRSAGIAAAHGSDYSKTPLRACWACAVPTPSAAERCLFCDAEREPPPRERQEPSPPVVQGQRVASEAPSPRFTPGTLPKTDIGAMPDTRVQEALDKIEASRKRFEDEHSNNLATEMTLVILLVVFVAFVLFAVSKKDNSNQIPSLLSGYKSNNVNCVLAGCSGSV